MKPLWCRSLYKITSDKIALQLVTRLPLLKCNIPRLIFAMAQNAKNRKYEDKKKIKSLSRLQGHFPGKCSHTGTACHSFSDNFVFKGEVPN